MKNKNDYQKNNNKNLWYRKFVCNYVNELSPSLSLHRTRLSRQRTSGFPHWGFLTVISTDSWPSPASLASMVNSTGRLAGRLVVSPGPLARTLLASCVGRTRSLNGLKKGVSVEMSLQFTNYFALNASSGKLPECHATCVESLPQRTWPLQSTARPQRGCRPRCVFRLRYPLLELAQPSLNRSND